MKMFKMLLNNAQHKAMNKDKWQNKIWSLVLTLNRIPTYLGSQTRCNHLLLPLTALLTSQNFGLNIFKQIYKFIKMFEM